MSGTRRTLSVQMPLTSLPIKPRVLVIERDIDIQKRIARSLDGLYSIDLTSSGSLALILMKDYRYSCILASIELPNRHRGLGILQALRSEPGGRYVPIIATAKNGSAVRPEVAREFIASLTFPDDIDHIEPVIEGVLEMWD